MIYVDGMHKRMGHRFNNYCHMMSDSGLIELHEFAEKLEVRRYFQNKPRHPHYDLSPNKRRIAISLGAIEITSEEMVKKCVKGLDHEKV